MRTDIEELGEIGHFHPPGRQRETNSLPGRIRARSPAINPSPPKLTARSGPAVPLFMVAVVYSTQFMVPLRTVSRRWTRHCSD